MYSIKEIRSKLVEILGNSGIDLYEDETSVLIEIDSLQFITLIVQIEEEFDILVDETILSIENLNIDSLAEYIEVALKDK